MKKTYSSKPENSRIFIFKQWSRKGFSLFRILKKIVIIAFLTVAYHIAADANSQVITSDTTKITMEVGLDEIEVSAQRAPVTYSQVARIVTVIEREEIEAAPVTSIQELLEYVQSVDIRQRGGEGVQADVSIRGSSFDQVMILLNGVDITDPQTGHHNLNLPVSLPQIQRIEIIEGPASRVFGPNAFSGAINFITHNTDKNSIAFQSLLGNYDFMEGSLSGSVRSGNIGQYISAGRSSSSGYITNTDFENNNLYYMLEGGVKNKIYFQLGYSAKSFGANSFYTPKYPDQYEVTKTSFSSLKWESGSTCHFSPTIFWRRHTDKFELFRNQAPSWYSSLNYHLTDVFGINLNGWFQTKFGKTAIGTNLRNDNIFSNVLGLPMKEPKKVKGENAQYTKSDSRSAYSIFLEQSIYSGPWALSAGVMANYITRSNLEVKFFPGLDVSFKLSDRVKIYATANKSLRMPTFTDLYYNGPTNIGNPELLPETANSAETGLKYNTRKIKGHLAFYYRNGKNIIDWVRLESEEKWHTENLTNLISSGFEVNLDYYPGAEIGGNCFITKISAGYMYNRLKKNNSQFISNYALDNLKHKFDFLITHKIAKNFSANWVLLAQDRNGSFTEFSNGKNGKEIPYKPFVLIDGKLNYKLKQGNLFVSVSNILDTNYFDIGNVRQAGRWIKAGVRFDMNFD